MRFSLLIVCLISFCSFHKSLQAQLIKGDRLFNVGQSNTDNAFIDNNPISSNLASFVSSDEFDGNILTGSVRYGFMLSDRVLLGSGLNAVGQISAGGSFAAAISPYGRYYFKNDPTVQLFGGAGFQFVVGDDIDLGDGLAFVPSLGASLPLTDNVLFSPELSYLINEGGNPITLNMQIEMILGRNNRVEKSSSSFGKGSFLLNAEVGGLSFGGEMVSTDFSFAPGVHYFLSDRFAIGAGIGLNITTLDRIQFNQTTIQTELDFRYYFTQDRHFTPFVQAGGVLIASRLKFDTGFGIPADQSESDLGFDLAIGSNLWIRDNVALEFGIGGRAFPDFDIVLITGSLGAAFLLNTGQ